MTDSNFEQLHKAVFNRPKCLRVGQAYFNYAYDMFPKEVDQLSGTDKDCFYNDKRIPAFLEALQKLVEQSSDEKENDEKN